MGSVTVLRGVSVVRRSVTVLVVVLLCLSLAAGPVAVVAGQDSTRVRDGGTYSGGTVVIEGEIDGDVRVFAGTVIIRGEVDGDVEAVAGSVQVPGRITGDLDATGGTVAIDGSVGGDVSAAAGTLAIDGSVGGDVRSASGSTELGQTAVVLGNLEYTGELERPDDARVMGSVDQRLFLQIGPVLVPPMWGWFLTAFAVLAHLTLGALLLLAFPGYSETVADRIERDPLTTGAAGLGVLVGVPVALIGISLTVVGIPVAIAGAFAFLFLGWIGLVYGRFAVGYVLLRRVGVDSRWLGLLVGLVGVGLLGQLPYVGALLRFLTLLLGLGALGVSAAREVRRRRGEIDAEPSSASENVSGESTGPSATESG